MTWSLVALACLTAHPVLLLSLLMMGVVVVVVVMVSLLQMQATGIVKGCVAAGGEAIRQAVPRAHPQAAAMQGWPYRQGLAQQHG